MPLTTSRQQFLAYETQGSDNLRYGKKGGIFITTCVCIGFVICAVLLCALVGIIVHYITYFKLSQKPTDYWDEKDPFGQSNSPSPDLQLPSDVVPSFYRLKLIADVENSNFSGDVYITLRANKKVKQIILHSSDLNIKPDATLTEQIYEKVEALQRRKRDVNNTTSVKNDTVTTRIANDSISTSVENNTIATKIVNDPISTSVENNTITSRIINNPVSTSLGNNVVTASITNNTTATNVVNNAITTSLMHDTITSNEENDTVTSSTAEDTSSVAEDTTDTNKTQVETTTTIPVSSLVTEKTIPINNATPSDDNTQVTHSNVRNIKIESISSKPGDRLILTLESSLKPDVDYTLQLSFYGKISDSLTGFYKSSYVNSQHKTKTISVTQFEPISARAAFPCFDEPIFKAQFEISIAHPENLTALSNMKVATQEPMPDKPGWQWTHFERSVKMSTYLVAYILSDFQSRETTYVSKDNVTKQIRIWTRPELISKVGYALTITPKLLKYYEDVFGVPYALDKIDLVAIPDFSSGAMENWGLITFRETTLIFDEETGMPRDKRNVAIDVAHELAHQWFGNLVTMQWWTDLWLNEGFATYIEYVGVDYIEPSWNMLEVFSHHKMDLMRSDALKNTSPISRQVVDASEISQKFDDISYGKGANLIRMLNHTISEETFHKGLVYYLNQWKYTNAQENDLWQAMSSASRGDPGLEGHSLVEFMNTWTKQAGYPVVKVTRNYGTGEVTFEQKLFTSSKNPYETMLNQIWQIPISYTTMETPVQQWTTRPMLWLTSKTAVKQLPVQANQALYVNVDAIGYYRVNYDQQNWELLSNALKSGLVKSPVTRSQLIDDAFNLAKANQMNYSYALDLTTYIINGDDSKMVWDILLNNMAFLKNNLKSTSGFSYFQDFMKIILQKQLEKLNFGLDVPKDDNEALLIENLLCWECFMESERCLKWVESQFDKLVNQSDVNNNPIPNHLRSMVYTIAIKRGGRREFDFLWRIFQNSTDPNVKSLIITSLPATNEENLVTMLLEESLSSIPNQYAAVVWNLESPVGTAVAQRFLMQNFQRVLSRFTSMDAFMFPSVLSGAFGLITKEEELSDLKSFALQHKDELMPMSQTLQKIVDSATLRIDWIKRHAVEINTWFRDYVNSHSSSLTSTASSKA